MDLHSLYRERHVVSAKDFNLKAFGEIFALTKKLKEIYLDEGHRSTLHSVLVKKQGPVRCRLLFGGASTRTSSSFEDAIETLGGIAKKDPLQFSSKSKGETLRSTARILGPRCDAIIIRDDEEVDAAKKMADAIEDYGLKTIIINAGDGNREHPTQMLLDIYTIFDKRPKELEDSTLTYALVGDLTDSRTIHSLLLGLSLYGGRVYLVGPEEENIPEWLKRELANSKLQIEKVSDPLSVAPQVDIWYFTRLQANLKTGVKVTPEMLAEYAKKYGASEELRRLMKKDALVLNPLPYGPEYQDGIDLLDKRFIHYEQADNGFFVRMALLKILFAPSYQI